MYAVPGKLYGNCVCAPIAAPDNEKVVSNECEECFALAKNIAKGKLNAHSLCLRICMQANIALKKKGLATKNCHKACAFLCH